MRGSFMRRFMMWALAREDSSDWASLAGCMILRYARHRPSMDARESWLGGKPSRSWGAGKGRKLGSLIVCIAGMMVVRVQGVWTRTAIGYHVSTTCPGPSHAGSVVAL